MDDGNGWFIFNDINIFNKFKILMSIQLLHKKLLKKN